jgi:hypothetical protein
MSQRAVIETMELIDFNSLKSGEVFLIPLKYEMFPDKKISLFKKGRYLVVHTVYWSKLDKCWKADQVELPFIGLTWIIEKLEGGFVTGNSSGLTDFDRSVYDVFDGECLGINIMVNCCAENLMFGIRAVGVIS